MIVHSVTYQVACVPLDRDRVRTGFKKVFFFFFARGGGGWGAGNVTKLRIECQAAYIPFERDQVFK